MHILKRSRIRLRLNYLRNRSPRRGIRQLLITREVSNATLPLLPWFVAASVEASAALQLALFVFGLLLASAWLGFVVHAVLPLKLRVENRRYMQVDRYLLSAEYHRLLRLESCPLSTHSCH